MNFYRYYDDEVFNIYKVTKKSRDNEEGRLFVGTMDGINALDARCRWMEENKIDLSHFDEYYALFK